MMAGWKRWQEHMFGYGSPGTLGVFRILSAGLIFVNLLMIALHWEDWFTERGYVPANFTQRWSENIPRFNLLYGVTDDRISLAFYILVCLAALFTAFGLWTKISSILLFIGIVTLHHRTPDILHSGDTLMRAFSFILMISPCGAAHSVDAWRRWKKSGEGAQEISVWPMRLVQYQLALVYFTTFWHKMNGNMWRDGTAVWYSGHLREFKRFPVPEFVYQPPFMQLASWGTLIVELALATLVFARPWRKWVLLSGLALHFGIEYSMNIPLFAFVICAGYVCFYEGEEVDALLDRVAAKLGRKPNEAPTA